MTRRSALAGSLLLTLALGFLVYSVGSRSGLFGSDSPGSASADAPSASTAAPTAVPHIIDTYVYEDGSPATARSSGAVGSDAWSEDDSHESDHDEDDEHHDGNSDDHGQEEHDEDED